MSEPEQKNSSPSTVLALYNNMLGGALLSFPILFRDAGLLTGTLVIIGSAAIAFATCRLYVLHTRDDEKDVEQSIFRILGKKWETSFRFITGTYIVFLNVITLDLIVDQLYSIIYFFFDMAGSGESIAPKDSLQFGQFSIQWLTLLIFLPLLALISIKKVDFLVKLCEYGSSSIFIYMIYVVYCFLLAAFKGEIDYSEITWFSSDLGNLAGTSSIAFTVHAFVVPFIKQNRHAQHNERDVGITYIIGFCTYELVAILGALAVTGKDCKNTFVDCYLTEWTILIVEITYFLGRLSAFPIMVEIGRTRLLELYFGTVTKKHFNIFNVCFMVFASIICILSSKLPLSILMSLVGAIFGFFFIYLIPTKFHFGCLYRKGRGKEPVASESLMSEQEQSLLSECSHDQQYVGSKSLLSRYVIYGVLNVIGVGVAVLALYSSVESIMNN